MKIVIFFQSLFIIIMYFCGIPRILLLFKGRYYHGGMVGKHYQNILQMLYS